MFPRWGKGSVLRSHRRSGERYGTGAGIPILDPAKTAKTTRTGIWRTSRPVLSLGPDPTDPEHSPATASRFPNSGWTAMKQPWQNTRGFSTLRTRRLLRSENADSGLCGIVREAPECTRVFPGERTTLWCSSLRVGALYAKAGRNLPTEAMWERAAIGTNERAYPGRRPFVPSGPIMTFTTAASCSGSLPAGASIPMSVSDLIGMHVRWDNFENRSLSRRRCYEYHIEPWWYPGMENSTASGTSPGRRLDNPGGCMSPGYRNSMTVMDGGISASSEGIVRSPLVCSVKGSGPRSPG